MKKPQKLVKSLKVIDDTAVKRTGLRGTPTSSSLLVQWAPLFFSEQRGVSLKWPAQRINDGGKLELQHCGNLYNFLDISRLCVI